LRLEKGDGKVYARAGWGRRVEVVVCQWHHNHVGFFGEVNKGSEARNFGA
jgi:hypothetical protein